MRLYLISLVAVVTLTSMTVWGTSQSKDQQPAIPQKVLIISPEQTTIFQTGGLAHATTGLAAGLIEAGIKTDVLMPYYLEMNAPRINDLGRGYRIGLDRKDGIDQRHADFRIVTSRTNGVVTYFLRHHPRPGGQNYFDNRLINGQTKKGYGPEAFIGESFGALAKAQVEFILENKYDLVILNDWTAGLVAPLLAELREQGRAVPKVVFAIHNIAYQGLFPKSLGDFLGMNQRHYHQDGYEYWNQLSFLKAGIQYSDITYTVSPRYAEEITTQRFGMGLDGLMRRKRDEFALTGILNGIDVKEWDPAHPHQLYVKHKFSVDDLSGKSRGKAELQEMFDLKVDSSIPLFILTSRLAEQKGLEYLPDAIAEAVQSNRIQVVIIGDGEKDYVAKAEELQKRFPEQVRYRRFSSQLERLATAYADFFINAAWFEPSGLNQFFALANGTIPVVSRVGGLASSVREGENGFLFDIIPDASGKLFYDTIATRKALAQAITQASNAFYRNPLQILKMKKAGMSESHSWKQRVEDEFLPLFSYVMKNGPNRLAGNAEAESKVLGPSELADLSGIPFPKISRPRTCSAVFSASAF